MEPLSKLNNNNEYRLLIRDGVYYNTHTNEVANSIYAGIYMGKPLFDNYYVKLNYKTGDIFIAERAEIPY